MVMMMVVLIKKGRRWKKRKKKKKEEGRKKKKEEKANETEILGTSICIICKEMLVNSFCVSSVREWRGLRASAQSCIHDIRLNLNNLLKSEYQSISLYSYHYSALLQMDRNCVEKKNNSTSKALSLHPRGYQLLQLGFPSLF